MIACTHPTEQLLKAAIIANPSEETLRFALADWLEEQGRYEAAGRVRETARIRPEGICEAHLYANLRTNGELPIRWLTEAVRQRHEDPPDEGGARSWPTESLGMAAILDAILEPTP